MGTPNEHLNQALALYDAMTPEAREQFMEMMREMVKAQEAARDADSRTAMTGECEQGAGKTE